ncbi:hypothetical protein OUZ56_023766 [Daphnia magna]|uniref:Uncharacterized protein n=1 Tax=Daphnia magna TaxID=35525 RepID=A0ABR0AZF9_9CRUS|nr:hypothetical protein OUZ56_023766 [Daphnia magna]
MEILFRSNHRLTDLYAVTGIVLILPVMNFSNDFLSRSDSRVFLMNVEMTNALGSKVKIHEVGNFCYGFDFVIEQFMKELLILESDEGMLLDIPHRPGFRVHGTLVSFCADTKGAHETGGFMSPSAKKFCRVCHISRNEIRDHGTTDNVVLRTKQSLDYQAQDALDNFPSGDPSAGVKEWNINKKEYGLNAACLNERFTSFHYGRYGSTNKPSPRFTDANLKEEEYLKMTHTMYFLVSNPLIKCTT